MNSHQRRIERRRYLRAGRPLPLWLWPHTITRASLDEVRPRGKRIGKRITLDDIAASRAAVDVADVCLSISEIVIA